jgi:hypothetical protein
MRSSARSPTPATSPGAAARHVMRIFGARRAPPRPIRSGVAISSPSRSRPVMSASTTGAARRAGAASCAALDAAFVGEFAQHALELGAVGVLQAEGARDLARADLAGLLADEGDSSSLLGKPMNCRVFSSLMGLARALPRGSASPRCAAGGLRRRCLARPICRRGARALLTADFGFAAASPRLLGGLAGARLWRSLAAALGGAFFAAAAWRRAALLAAAAWRRGRRSAADGLVERDGLRRLVARQRGVDAVVADIGP